MVHGVVKSTWVVVLGRSTVVDAPVAAAVAGHRVWMVVSATVVRIWQLLLRWLMHLRKEPSCALLAAS